MAALVTRPAKTGQFDFLQLRQQLKDRIRMKKSGGSAAAQGCSVNSTTENFGSFFGPSERVMAKRVHEEMKDFVPELKKLASRVLNSGDKAKSTAKSPAPLSKALKCKIIKESRDYSFLQSDSAEIPKPSKGEPEEVGKSKTSSAKSESSSTKQCSTKPMPKQKKSVSKHPIKYHVKEERPEAVIGKASLANKYGKVNRRVDPGHNSGILLDPSIEVGIDFVSDVAIIIFQRLKSIQLVWLTWRDVYHAFRTWRDILNSWFITTKQRLKQMEQSVELKRTAKPIPKPKLSVSKNQVKDRVKEEQSLDVSSVIQAIFGHNRKRPRADDEDDDGDDRAMVSSFDDILKEERKSAKIAREEDERERLLLEQEEKQEEGLRATKKLKIKIKLSKT
ncbi:uncharacterized protein LOC125470310 [Pyrus x bretschneideri]|uniref:uncharacterized protein LOC125470310 n=1 Tax=Pyrus x bretschneideri TaxID=225117 RepID=UPI00202EA82A|nr:uncharacterized protein LOC125470310 [Pyrus x bretschneideri]